MRFAIKAMARLLTYVVMFTLIGQEAIAQANESDTRVTAIELIGRDLVRLLNQLTEGEKDPTKRLPITPILNKATKAVQDSPIFQQAQSNKKSLEGQRKEVRAGLLPQISLGTGSGTRDYDVSSGSGGYTRYSGDYATRTLTAKQLLYDFGGVWSSMTATEKRLIAAELKAEAQRSEIFLQSLKIFYETQRGLLQVRLARENLQARRAFVNFIRERSDLGASSSADVVRAESRVAEALDSLSTALQTLAQAQASYRQFYNAEAEPYILPKEISYEGLDIQNMEQFLDKHPAKIETEMNLQAARDELSAAKSKYIGGLYLEISKGQSKNPGSSQFIADNTTMLMFRSDLYAGGAQSARIEQAVAKVEQAEFEVERVKQDLLRSMREAYAEYNGQVAGVAARMLVFKGAEDSYAIAKDLYAFSRSSLFEVLKSQEDLFNAGQRLIDSIVNRAQTKYKLLHAAQVLISRVNENNTP
jgi:adhesin transport system outer membrane protein